MGIVCHIGVLFGCESSPRFAANAIEVDFSAETVVDLKDLLEHIYLIY